jgi:GntR family transcriptional repressor for pyruvate dehydrogenase complex
LTKSEMNPNYRRKNMRTLRRHLRMTQKEFLNFFLMQPNGKPAMSVATYSNLESKGGDRVNEVVTKVCQKLDIDAAIFSAEPSDFSENITVMLGKDIEERLSAKENREGANISELVNRLTMYFADGIYNGTLEKGSRIESDRELAGKMGVGRSAIREALKVLNVLGMIDIRPGQGTFISQKESDFFIIPLSWSLFINRPQTENILQVRNLIEVGAARLAAQSHDEAALSKLYLVSNEIYNAYVAKDYQKFLEADLNFHICIAVCSENSIIYAMIQTIRNLLKRVSQSGMVDDEQMTAIYNEHKQIFGSIIAKNPDAAAAAMARHLENSLERYNYQ